MTFHRVECDPSTEDNCGCRCHRRCGVLMRFAKEPCARLAGHKPTPYGGHRSAFAMACDNA